MPPSYTSAWTLHFEDGRPTFEFVRRKCFHFFLLGSFHIQLFSLVSRFHFEGFLRLLVGFHTMGSGTFNVLKIDIFFRFQLAYLSGSSWHISPIVLSQDYLDILEHYLVSGSKTSANLSMHKSRNGQGR